MNNAIPMISLLFLLFAFQDVCATQETSQDLEKEVDNAFNQTDDDIAFGIFEKKVGVKPNSQSVVPTEPCIELPKKTYKTGEPLLAFFFSPTPDKKDWIRVFKKSESDNRAYNRRWSHLNGDNCGRVTLEGVNEVGDYETRLFKNGNYDVVARASFSIEDYKSFPFSPSSNQIRIATWNIYYFNNDSTTLKKRNETQLNKLARRMVEFEAGIIAIQEVNTRDVNDLVDRMSRISGDWKAVVWDGIAQAFIYDENQIDMVSHKTLENENASTQENGKPVTYPQLSFSAYVPIEIVFKPVGATCEEQNITLLSVHLLYAYEEERLKQAKWLSFYLHDWMQAHSKTTSIVVAGDFNGAPWSQTGKNMRCKKGVHYVPRINGNSSYYDHFYASQDALNHIPAKSSFVITPSQYNENATSFFKMKVKDDWHMTYSDHYPVFIDYQVSTRSVVQDETNQKIKGAFDQHVDYFNSEMVRRLAKDKNGNSDTYVLYDVQMHLQNAAIYADEQGNKEMLGKLLELCLIPFEERHMNHGKWLNNTYGLVGVEVDLCIAQYFSLLTRVLSACQRHGVEVRFSDEQIQIVISHIDGWLEPPVNRDRVDDRHLFFVQSVLQFHDFTRRIGKPIKSFESWKQYVQDYLSRSIAPKWENTKHIHDGKQYDCWMLDRTGWADYHDNRHAGHGSDVTKTASDTDTNAMFHSDGTVKQPEKKL